jgi:hypothetical protein
MKKEYLKIREILIRLFQHQRSLLRKGLPEHDRLSSDFPPMDNESTIYYLMKDIDNCQSDFCRSGQYFYLPPMKKEPKIVPLLLLDCDFSNSQDDISFIIILNRFLNNKSNVSERIAFRFEGPEGLTAEKSRHKYWHMQVTNEIAGRNGYQKIICRNWLPDKMPCIPIISRGPVSLLLCVLFSFYGKQMYEYIDLDKIEKKYLEPLNEILLRCK